MLLIRTQENSEMYDAQNAVDRIKRLLNEGGLGDMEVEIMDGEMEELLIAVLSSYNGYETEWPSVAPLPDVKERKEKLLVVVFPLGVETEYGKTQAGTITAYLLAKYGAVATTSSHVFSVDWQEKTVYSPLTLDISRKLDDLEGGWP